MSTTFRVLMIDDSSSDVFLIQEILLSSLDTRFQMEASPTLASGLQKLQEIPFDLVLLDLSLPDSRGLDTFKAIQKAHPVTPVIVMSGLDDQKSVQTIVDNGAQDYLVKGEISSNQLKRAIVNAVLRKNRELQLALFQNAMDSTRAGILICDRDGKIIFSNKAAAVMHGSSAALLEGQNVQTLSNDLKEFIAGDGLETEGSIVRRDGSRLPVRFIVDAIPMAANPQKFVVAMFGLE